MAKRNNPAVNMPQSKEECAIAIAAMAHCAQELELLETAASEKIAVINAATETEVAPLRAEHEALRKSVQSYCEVNRSKLLVGKAKSFKFTTGVVSWVKGKSKLVGDTNKARDLIMTLKKRGYTQCFKTVTATIKSELNKLPDVVIEGLPGIEREPGVESFTVKPNAAVIDVGAEPTRGEVA